MKQHVLTAIGLAVLLAGCGQKTENGEAAANMASGTMGDMGGMAGNMSSDMGNMAMPGEMMSPRMAKGTGTVTAIDKAEGSITIDHAPIPEANWPAMTMAFRASPELLEGVQVGDEIAFDLALEQGGGEVMAISKK